MSNLSGVYEDDCSIIYNDLKNEDIIDTAIAYRLAYMSIKSPQAVIDGSYSVSVQHRKIKNGWEVFMKECWHDPITNMDSNNFPVKSFFTGSNLNFALQILLDWNRRHFLD